MERGERRIHQTATSASSATGSARRTGTPRAGAHPISTSVLGAVTLARA
jgi:hypothetical protein